MRPADQPVAEGRRPIARPPHSRAGTPAPWAGLPVDRRTGITLQRVVGALTDDGSARNGLLVEPWRHHPAPTSVARPAAVLVPLFEEGGETRVVLTVRSDRLRSHQGEVAFPGGRIEGDEGVVAAALREADEEVGLQPELVTVVGSLTTLPTVSSNTVMTPVVATLEDRPSLVASPAEVDRVFDVALCDLAADGVFHEEWWTAPADTEVEGLPEGEFPVWFFEVAGETVWGATARTLVELLCLVLGVDVPSSLRSAP
jgi:8-oxo-dGTP pyrophosphatase MutT (NUDIX family)